MAGSDVDALLIHAVYLLNAASEDAEIREQDADVADRVAAGRRRAGRVSVVLHPGSARRPARSRPAIKRARRGRSRRRWPRASAARCTWRTPRAPAARWAARSSELAALIDAAGGDERLGMCLDSCHLYASGFDIRTAEGLTQVLDECDDVVGLDRLGSLHFNDSQGALGSNRDRHADVGQGELGEDGCAVFLERAALRRPAGDPRDAGPRQEGPDEGGAGAVLGAARARAEGARVGARRFVHSGGPQGLSGFTARDRETLRADAQRPRMGSNRSQCGPRPRSSDRAGAAFATLPGRPRPRGKSLTRRRVMVPRIPVR